MNRRFSTPTLVLAATLAWPLAAVADKAHQHGAARLDIAQEGRLLSLALEAPLDDLLGFERAPRTDAERRSVEAVLASLRAGGRLFRIDPAANCTLTGTDLVSAPLKLGPAAAQGPDGHGDLEANWRFDCAGAAPAHVDVGLFEAFKRMGRIEVQVATAKGQARTSLKRPATRVVLPR
ncbi:DUF2796 domain-containing protein [Ideonella sp. A 288]|uniref:DUF2796 domain-containing protein n=1 Tax=Ideonella sp. A 288 TaxID=1962181 RepID=UPI001303837A|nr:DUF2796 domain-containing protein [Ideonella sp. A 288]